MKHRIILLILSGLLFSCGSNQELISDSSVTEDQVARSLIQQEGERPKIDPESLSPKVPPQNIISSSGVAPSDVAVEALPAEVPEEKIVITEPVSDTLAVADTTVIVQETDTVAVAKLEVAVAVTKIDTAATVRVEDEAAAEAAPPPAAVSGLKFQNLSFDDIYFENKEWAMPSSTFNSNYYVTLGKIVKALRSDPEIKVRISGYTDYEGSEQFNYQLSQKRAITFGKILIDLFPAEMKSKIAQRIEINPQGSQDLLVESSNKARRTLNRRVSFELFYGDLQNNPYTVYMDQGAKPITASSTAGSMQQRLYDKAMALFNQKRYFEAIEIFSEILSIDPKHSLADNAQFWIGEALYYQEKYPEALQTYRKVFGLGNGNKEAAAQMRLGYCYFRMNQLEQAVTEFQKVRAQYPNAHEEIRRSENLLAKIRNY